jgi:hypothetical protein
MDIEEREVFPLSPHEALNKCRTKIRGLHFPTAPNKTIKTRGIVSVMDSSHFGFIYSRNYKHFFLFIDAYSGEDIERDAGFNVHCSIMEIYVIKGDKHVFIEQFNIAIHNPVFTSPTSP